ncbi:MAG: putative ABC transport system permease protein [Pseudohongiellaceae bacterium]|jgi:putative ABC transport system permease protein
MWFDLIESLRSALSSIRAHGFRSFLTTLGIVIGVAAVIGMVSIIQGLNYTINQQFEGLGTNSLIIQSYTPLVDRLQGRISRITENDLELVKARIDGISSITPIIFSNGSLNQIQYGSQLTTTQIAGTTYSYQDVGQIFIKNGRFLSVSDNNTRRRVAVIGEEIRTNLSLPENPIGEFVKIGDEWVRIIGLAEERGQILGQSQDNYMVVPFTTMRTLAGNQVEPDIRIQLTISDISQTANIKNRITALLRDAHNLEEEDDNDFQVQTSEQLASTITSILGSVTLVMGGIVSISLLVGGIGIMNIMLVSVTERTREIGICKAIGAKRHQILLQFLFESLLLCLLGGLIGLLLGFGIGVGVAAAIGIPQAYVPLWAVLLAFGFSAFVGIVFGIMPAAKAANLDPIEALRYE